VSVTVVALYLLFVRFFCIYSVDYDVIPIPMFIAVRGCSLNLSVTFSQDLTPQVNIRLEVSHK